MTDGIAAVQARISEIQSMFATSSPAVAPASAGTTAGASFADTLAQAQGTATATGVSSETATVSGAGSADESKVVEGARKYLGIPYVWGGTDPAKGLDCSGLTQQVYKDLGIDIPRVSYDQAKAGRAVEGLDNARPGDLVFYDYSSSRPGIDHVAIYIGDGKIIEAPRPGSTVKVSDVGNPISIRRILPEDATASVAAGTAPAAAAPVGASASVPAAAPGGLSGVPYGDLFAQAGAKHGVPAALLAAVAKTESGFNPTAVSPAGAQGLMQFMPATAAGMGVNALNPASAVDGAAKYLAGNLREFGTVELALAAYNAGPGNVRKYDGVPPFDETRNYITKVKSAWEEYR